MTADNPTIGRIRDDVRLINDATCRLLGGQHVVFSRLPRIPMWTSPRCGYRETLPWLWSLYCEIGRLGVAFLEKKFGVYALDADGVLSKYRHRLGRLRVYEFHDLNPGNHQDKGTITYVENWFETCCGYRQPAKDTDWELCLSALLMESLRFGCAIREVIARMESDESRKVMRQDWLNKIARDHPEEDFDNLIPTVAADMGLPSINAIEIRSRYYRWWKSRLDAITGVYSFDTEARRLIEHALIMENSPALPITGGDLIDELGILPGPQVFRLLRVARRLLEDSESNVELERGELMLRLGPAVDEVLREMLLAGNSRRSTRQRL